MPLLQCSVTPVPTKLRREHHPARHATTRLLQYPEEAERQVEPALEFIRQQCLARCRPSHPTNLTSTAAGVDRGDGAQSMRPLNLK